MKDKIINLIFTAEIIGMVYMIARTCAWIVGIDL